MKREVLAMSIAGWMACCSSGKCSSEQASPYLPLATIPMGDGDGAHVQLSRLAVPVRRPAGLCFVAFHLVLTPVMVGPNYEKALKERNQVSVPQAVLDYDASSGALIRKGYTMNGADAAYFGIPRPPGGVVGHFDDANALPADRIEVLRQRIFAALDVLAPLFGDEHRPWTSEANKAAQEVRDFFPLAAEPGLWPYYKAEGREFFSWVERNAPPGKAPLPWEAPAQ